MQKSTLKKAEVPLLLDANKARESLNDLHGWQLTDDHKMTYREFILLNFMAAVDLIDRIALIAEDAKHHPDIHLTQYRNLRVGLTTHEVGGLSEKDPMVASKINGLPILFNKHNNGAVIDQQLQKKDKLMQKPRFEQKEVQPQKRKIIGPVLRKGKSVKTNGLSKKSRSI